MGNDGEPEILKASPSKDEIVHLLETYPLSTQALPYTYGTAGFRLDAKLMPCIMVRVGIFAAFRARYQKREAVGVMVTASHNDESYNGVKISDPDGGMVAPDGEELVVQVANETNVESVLNLLQLNEVDKLSCDHTAIVHVGRDTRSHSEDLANLVMAAARAAGATVLDHGLVTTPCLHHCVLHANAKGGHLPSLIPPHPNARGYYELLAKSYAALLSTRNNITQSSLLLVDCACGIGFPALQQLVHEIQAQKCMRRIVATNRPTSGPLNGNCGSEYVQKNIAPPTWYGCPPISKDYCAAFDGDADRIVFFSQATGESNGMFKLLDGDKISCLFCNFIRSQLDALKSSLPAHLLEDVPTVGAVQTAYANGAATTYLNSVLGSSGIKIAKTGVKHVHAAAHSFDVGVYFEANGHGTVLFGKRFYSFVESAECALAATATTPDIRRSKVALERLKLLPSLVNQAVGDALSDLLLVDAILELEGQTIHDWNGLYQDLPSRQAKVRVRDRTIIKTNECETRCLEPAGVQDALEQASVACGGQGRAFVRPSGTEDVVRIYAEARTREQADMLAQRACEIVHEKCGGIGQGPPTLSKM